MKVLLVLSVGAANAEDATRITAAIIAKADKNFFILSSLGSFL